jgi:arylsulfatase
MPAFTHRHTRYRAGSTLGERFGNWALLISLVVATMPAVAAGTVADAAARPNILVILADDLGYSDLGAFGGEINTPNLDKLAGEGLRMTQFHTTATCSPTRSMLMTGVDHHIAGIGNMVELLTPEQKGHPGYEGYLNRHVVTLPQLLRDAGYETIISGKWHLGVEPDQDPAERGFEHSFASLPAGNNHFGLMNSPGVNNKTMRYAYTENGKTVDSLPADYYSSDYFTQRLIGFMKERDRNRPFFAYLPFTAPHTPLQAPAEMIAKYKGHYDQGWNVLWQQRLERQRKLGVLPLNAAAQEPATLLSWDELSAEDKRYSARNMEIYAAMVDRMDWNIGRVLDYLRDTGDLDNTLVIFLSDNGAEGANIIQQTFMAVGIRIPPTPFEQLGSATSKTGYGPHWAQASTMPFRLFKANMTQGGLVSPTIIRYPRFERQGQIDPAFATVMDIAPTVLDLAGVEHPGTKYRDRDVAPLDGRSMLPYLQGRSDRVHGVDEAVGWELFGQRALRQDHWKIAWISKPNGSSDWELYDLERDPGERHDLSEDDPQRLRNMIRLWEQYARDKGVILHEQMVSPYNAPVI